jgi:hypothetical protein
MENILTFAIDLVLTNILIVEPGKKMKEKKRNRRRRSHSTTRRVYIQKAHYLRELHTFSRPSYILVTQNTRKKDNRLQTFFLVDRRTPFSPNTSHLGSPASKAHNAPTPKKTIPNQLQRLGIYNKKEKTFEFCPKSSE